MHDKFRKRHKLPPASARLRHQIALEAARRMCELLAPAEGDALDLSGLDRATEGEYYTAKRKAAAVLGHRVRPGDLPSDAEVREQLVILARSRSGLQYREAEPPEPSEEEAVPDALADHLDRFALYKLRLVPLE